MDNRAIADPDSRQLGFLEVAIDVDSVGRHKSEHLVAHSCVITRLQLDVGDDPVHGRSYRGSLQIQPCQVSCDALTIELSGQLVDLGLSLFDLFGSSQVGEPLVSGALAPGLC